MPKRLALMLSLGALWVFLAGCVLIFDDRDLIRNAAVRTSELAPGIGYYVCDARSTWMTYEFTPSPLLDRWTSYLQGVEDPTDRRVFLEDLRPVGDSRVTRLPNNRLQVTFEIPAGAAPLSLEPQAIVFEGNTRLVIEARDAVGNIRPYASRPIPVRDPCF